MRGLKKILYCFRKKDHEEKPTGETTEQGEKERNRNKLSIDTLKERPRKLLQRLGRKSRNKNEGPTGSEELYKKEDTAQQFTYAKRRDLELLFTEEVARSH